MKRMTKSLGLAAMALATVLPVASARAVSARADGVATAATNCAVTWGSLPKQDGVVTSSDALRNVRAGRHDCYDRLVLDGATWARAGYVDQVYEDGSGKLVPLRGGARLQIVTTRSDDVDTGAATYVPANPKELVGVSGWTTFRQVAFAGDFEGQTTIGLGVRARLPFRVFTLTASGQPPRIVIDVAHSW